MTVARVGGNRSNKLVVAVASRALFDLEKENKIFNSRGLEPYREYQRSHEKVVLKPGAAFPLVSKLLRLNRVLKGDFIEVVVVSRNDADTSVRIFNSIKHHELPISRGAFTNGAPNHTYLEAFSSSLYLSAHLEDVRRVLDAGFAAAHVLGSPSRPTSSDDNELRIGFDFDGVLASDESERIYQNGGLTAFLSHEVARRSRGLPPGPLFEFLRQLAILRAKAESRGEYPIRTAIITARNAPAHERVISTLRADGIVVDETFFLGGLKKAPFVTAFRPDIFFEDQLRHLQHLKGVATAYVPYGVMGTQADTHAHK